MCTVGSKLQTSLVFEYLKVVQSLIVPYSDHRSVNPVGGLNNRPLIRPPFG